MLKNYEFVKFFMLYMFNRWCAAESKLVFGETLGCHIYNKYLEYRRNGRDYMEWFAEIDDACKERLVARAIAVYTQPTT